MMNNVKFQETVKYLESNDSVKNRNSKKYFLECKKEKDKFRPSFMQYRDGDGFNLLQHAIKNNKIRQAHSIQEVAPHLIFVQNESRAYEGLSALHIALMKGYTDIARQIILCAKNILKVSTLEIRNKLFLVPATGYKLKQPASIYKGESPFFIAVLMTNTDIVNIMLELNPELLFECTSEGDTVFHCMVKYIAHNRTRTEGIRFMFAYIKDKVLNFGSSREQTEKPTDLTKNDRRENDKRMNEQYHLLRHILFKRNHDNYTALQLCGVYGIPIILGDLLDIIDVYKVKRRSDDDDFDQFEFDISDFDDAMNALNFKPQKTGRSDYGRKSEFANIYSPTKRTETFLEIMTSPTLSADDKFGLLVVPPIKNIVKRKWNKLSKFNTICMVIHIVMMGFQSTYAARQAELTFVLNATEVDRNALFHDSTTGEFLTVVKFILLAYTLFCIIIFVIHCVAKVMHPKATRYWKKHMFALVVLLFYAFPYWTDVIWTFLQPKQDMYFQIVSLISGWCFVLFFLRGIESFGYFTAKFTTILSYFWRFGFVMCQQLISFTTIMIILYRGTGVNQIDGAENDSRNAYNFRRFVSKMFHLMVGLSSAEGMEQTTLSGLTFAVYIVFVLLTYILFTNFLIATLTATWSAEFDQQQNYWRLMQLENILFFEVITNYITFFKKYPFRVGNEQKVYILDPLNKSPSSRSTDWRNSGSFVTRLKFKRKTAKKGAFEDIADMDRYLKLRQNSKIISDVIETKTTPPLPVTTVFDNDDNSTESDPYRRDSLVYPHYHEYLPEPDESEWLTLGDRFLDIQVES